MSTHSALRIHTAQGAFAPLLLLFSLCFVLARLPARAQDVSSFTVNPGSIKGGGTVTGTVTLNAPAAAGGQVVQLSVLNFTLTMPATITVPAGQTTATVSIGTPAVTQQTYLTLEALSSRAVYTPVGIARLILSVGDTADPPPSVQSIGLSSSTVVGGQTVRVTVTLSKQAPLASWYGGVTLSCSNNSMLSATFADTPYVSSTSPLPVSRSVGQDLISFTSLLNTSTVNYPQTVVITATSQDDNSVVNASLTLLPAYIRVTDYMPRTMKLAWDAPIQSQFRYVLIRSAVSGTPALRSNSTVVAILAAGVQNFTDVFDFVNGTKYLYELFATDLTSPVSAGNFITGDGSFGEGPGIYGTALAADMVIPYQHTALDNQTVDSRLDLRYSDVHYKDFKFGTRIYRGGLYAGYAANPDQSQVARSFAKFQIGPPPAASASLRSADVCLYFTGATNSINDLPIGCQTIANSDWLSPDLVWTQAPQLGATSPVVNHLAWDKTQPAPQWIGWNLYQDIYAATQRAGAGTDSRLSVVVRAPDEAQAGWAYFARKEYDATLTPAVTHVWDLAIPLFLYACSHITYTAHTVPLNQWVGPPSADQLPYSSSYNWPSYSYNPTAPYGPVTDGTNVFWIDGTTYYAHTIIANGLNPGDTATVLIDRGLPSQHTETLQSILNTFNSAATSATLNGVTVYARSYPGTSTGDCNQVNWGNSNYGGGYGGYSGGGYGGYSGGGSGGYGGYGGYP